ncbi:alpha/beta fold hydrolase [Cellulomonas massiliensis]|uniref:alpha/beta fold hydrolase n=1 Tax=Cellulomonas massiliensis TaxID=1465811 RepID=UPI001FE71448|nr:alpha/beta fold hydrolase [Cellulomonas massiliensis]
MWTPQLTALLRSGHPAVAVDLPGHGARADERFTRPGALAVLDVAVRGCAEPPLLVGLSLGGYTSLAYAAEHPGRVAGVLLAGCSTEIKGKPLGLYRRASRVVTRALHIGGDDWSVVEDMLASMAGYSPLTDLRRVDVPVWLVNGRRDPLRLDERRYVGSRPGVRLHVVRRAGHDVNMHAPVAFNRVLLDALHALAPRERLAPVLG